MTSPKFITISTISDAWGDTTSDPDFNSDREARKIASAAEAHGIEVYVDTAPPRDYKDGPVTNEVDWFATWCREGYEWSEQQWIEFFGKC